MSGEARDAIRTMGLIVLITFVAETVVMATLSRLGAVREPLGLALSDALLLSLVIAPPIYWLVRRPLRAEYLRRVRAESEAAAASRLARIDPLTGTLNRRAVLEHLRDAQAAADRYEHPLSVALLDVDQLKAINDTHGHDAGDWALRETAAIVGKSLRAADKIGRWGGDEFLVVLSSTDPAATHVLTDRLRELVSRHEMQVRGRTIGLSLSIGATTHEPGESSESLLLRADRALYEAKESGRNRVVSRHPATEPSPSG